MNPYVYFKSISNNRRGETPPRKCLTPVFNELICFRMNCNLFLPDHNTYQKRENNITHKQKNELIQYNTHNPRFTVRKGAAWQRASGPLCPPAKVSLVPPFSEIQFMWWTNILRKKINKDMLRNDKSFALSVDSSGLQQLFLSCVDEQKNRLRQLAVHAFSSF